MTRLQYFNPFLSLFTDNENIDTSPKIYNKNTIFYSKALIACLHSQDMSLMNFQETNSIIETTVGCPSSLDLGQ